MKTAVRTLTKRTLFIILGFMVFNLSVIPISFGQATQLEVVAPTTNIQVSTQFNVDITVTDVADLYSWQIKLYYNSTVLRWINATYPPGHVFEGKPNYPVLPSNTSDAGGTYIQFFLTLVGGEPGFNGGGTLCRFSFEAKSAGTSSLAFSDATRTYLLDSDGVDISYTAVDASVTVVGVDTRLPSAISINVDPASVYAGSNATISGAINVTVADNTPVYIEYWNTGLSSWKPLATVYTSVNQYSYIWLATEEWWVGVGSIRARWEGNTGYFYAYSIEETVEVLAPWTWIKVQPKSLTAGSKTVLLPTLPFNMSIVVQNVTDLYQWQIKLYFNPIILQALDAWIPSDNVFGDNYTPLQETINNTAGFIQASTSSSVGSFTGNGTLLQVSFKGIGAPTRVTPVGGALPYNMGHDTPRFDRTVTQLKNSTEEAIPFKLEDPPSEITIFSSPKAISRITLDFYSDAKLTTEVKVGSNVTIQGQITDALGATGNAGVEATVKIVYNVTKFNVEVPTDANSKYGYLWNANQTGLYSFEASWNGDADYQGATSGTRVFRVVTETTPDEEEGGPDIMLYAAILGIAVVAVLAVVVYLKKFRKPARQL
jgi:hypothetical protein